MMERLTLKHEEGPKTQQMRSYLGRSARVTLTDGRVIYGQLRVFDKRKNIVLAQAEEEWKVTPIPDPTVWEHPDSKDTKDQKLIVKIRKNFEQCATDARRGIERRIIGQVLIPGSAVVKVELDLKTPADQQPWQVPHAQMGDEFAPVTPGLFANGPPSLRHEVKHEEHATPPVDAASNSGNSEKKLDSLD